MSLEKAIEHGQEHRRPYYDSRAFDGSCRCHGGDSWDYTDRMIRDLKQAFSAKEQFEEQGLPGVRIPWKWY